MGRTIVSEDIEEGTIGDAATIDYAEAIVDRHNAALEERA